MSTLRDDVINPTIGAIWYLHLATATCRARGGTSNWDAVALSVRTRMSDFRRRRMLGDNTSESRRHGSSIVSQAALFALVAAVLPTIGGSADAGDRSRLLPAVSASGTASVTPTQTMTPSSTPWGMGVRVCQAVLENDMGTWTCPAGMFISEVVFASFGTPAGGERLHPTKRFVLHGA